MSHARIIFAGSPDFAVPPLQRLIAGRHEVVAVLTQPDKPAGRGRKLTACPVKTAAAGAGLRVLQPASLHESLLQAQLRALAADLMVVVAYGQLLPAAVLAIPRIACINIHGSLLPRWRGAAPVQTALRAGDAKTGVCLMQMDEGLDTGPVYSCAQTDIRADDTSATLHARLAELGADLLTRELDAILNGQLLPRAQPEAGVSYAPRIKKSDGRIEWSDAAAAVDCLIRAFNPWPVATTSLAGTPLRCWNSRLAAESLAPDSDQRPGAVLGLEGDGLRVRTGAGVIVLTEIQLPGRKPVSGREFANAHSLDGLVLGI